MVFRNVAVYSLSLSNQTAEGHKRNVSAAIDPQTIR